MTALPPPFSSYIYIILISEFHMLLPKQQLS